MICRLWSEFNLAYLASDGLTVRPMPGMEVQFAGFVRRFRKTQPDLAARYSFEGPVDGR